jgi:O-antigen/teichoic acid export membrane protein
MAMTAIPAADLEPSLVSSRMYVTRRRLTYIDAATVLGLTVALITLVPSPLVLPGMTDLARPGLVVGFLLFWWWVLARFALHLAMTGPQPIRWALLVFMVSALASYAVGSMRGLTTMESNAADRAMLFYCVLAGIILTAADGIPNWLRLRAVLKAVVCCATIVALIALVQYVFLIDVTKYMTFPGLQAKGWIIGFEGRGGGVRVASTTAHYIELAAFLALTLPFAIHFACYSRSSGRRQLALAATAIIAGGLAATISRTGILALGLALLVLFPVWTWRQRYNVAAIAAVLGGAAAAVSPGLVRTLLSLFDDPSTNPAFTVRAERYPMVFRYVGQAPWLGRGTGTWVAPQYTILDNQWLDTLLSNGVIGVTALAGLHLTAIVLAFKALRRSTTAQDRHLCAALISTQVVGLAVAGTFDSLSFSTFAVILALNLGFCGTVWRLTHPNRAVRTLTTRWFMGRASSDRLSSAPSPRLMVVPRRAADTTGLPRSPADARPPAADAARPEEESAPGRSRGADTGGTALSSGVRWSGISVVGREGCRVAFTIALARMVGPDAFGIVAQAVVYIGVVGLLLDQGFSSALIQRPRLEEGMAGAVVTVNLAVGAALTAVTLAVAPAWAAFMGSPELTLVLAVLAPCLFVRAVSITPRALLMRGMQFRKIGIADVSGAVTGGAAGVVAAALGASYWALVVQIVVTDLVTAVVMLSAGAGSWPNLRMHRLRQIAGFSWRAFAAGVLINSVSRNIDNILVGRFRGPQQLAFYGLAYRLLLLPVQLASTTIGAVLFPAFSRLAGNVDALRTEMARATRALATLALPGMALVAVSAPQVVLLLFGPQWAPAVPIVQVLAMVGALQAIYQPSTTPLVLGLGHAGLNLRLAWLTTLVATAGIVAGLPFGALGVAIGYSVATCLLLPVEWVIRRRMLGMTVRHQLATLIPGLHVAIWVAATYLLVALAITEHDLIVLALGVPAALGAGTAALRLFHRAQLTELIQVSGRLVGRTRLAAAADA